jgi:hypothetical protein
MQRVIVSVAAFVVLVLSVSVAATAQSFSSGSTGANGFVTVLLISVAPIVSAQSQKPLTNEDVVKMVAAGLPESTIVQVIQKGPTAFDTSPDALIKLKRGGATPKIMEAMLGLSVRAPGTVGTVSAPSGTLTITDSALASDPRTEDVGFYLIEDGKPIQLQATGFSGQKDSVLRALKTGPFGRYKEKAVLRGSSALVRSKITRPQFLLHAPEGGSPGDYVVVKLEQKDQTREAVVGSRSVFRGGSTGFEDKGVMKFSSIKLATRKYLIKFDAELEPGEYGFYPVSGLQGGARVPMEGGVSATGRLYDFGIDH